MEVNVMPSEVMETCVYVRVYVNMSWAIQWVWEPVKYPILFQFCWVLPEIVPLNSSFSLTDMTFIYKLQVHLL